MRITKLTLTNFRSFKEAQTIEIAPITMLFGPNSVGKSSVLMALFYLQQIIEKGQCNPQRLEALGNKFVFFLQQTSNKMSLITILNWSKYQDDEQQNEQQAT